jgi:hypothetical protein
MKPILTGYVFGTLIALAYLYGSQVATKAAQENALHIFRTHQFVPPEHDTPGVPLDPHSIVRVEIWRRDGSHETLALPETK